MNRVALGLAGWLWMASIAWAQGSPKKDEWAGSWLFTLPLGYQYEVELRPLGDQRYEWTKGPVRFQGVLLRKGEQLRMTSPREEGFVPLVWKWRENEYFELVEEPREGEGYVGAKLTPNRPATEEEKAWIAKLQPWVGDWRMRFPNGERHRVSFRVAAFQGKPTLTAASTSQHFHGWFELADKRLRQVPGDGFLLQIAEKQRLIVERQGADIRIALIGAVLERE